MDLDRYIKRKTIIVQIFIVSVILYLIAQSVVIAIKGNNKDSIITIDFLRQFSTQKQAHESIKPFYADKGTIEYIVDDKTPLLSFKSYDMPKDVYNGFGIFKTFYAMENSKLYLTWKSSSLDVPVPVSIHFSDNPPKEQKGKVGEDYIFNTLPPDNEWEDLIIPISQFEYNEWWQPDNVYDDGILNINNLIKLEFSINTTEQLDIQIKDLFLKSEVESVNFILVFVFYTLLGIFLLIRTILSLENYITSIYIRIGYTLSVLILALNYYIQYSHEQFIEVLLLVSIFSIFYLIDELSKNKLDSIRFLQLRYLLIYLIFFSVDYTLMTRLIFIQMILYPNLSKRDKSMFLFTCLGIMIYHSIISIRIESYQVILYSLFVMLLNYISLEIVLLKGDRSQLESALTLYNGIFHHSRDFIFTTDNRGNFTSINRAFSQLLNKSPKELIGSSVLEYISVTDRDKFGLSNKSLARKINRFDTKLGSGDTVHRVYICETPILVKGKLVGHQVLATDISDRVKMEEELREANKQLEILVDIDGLTQIANRRFFDRHLDIEVKRFLRSGKTLSIMLLDVDYFKKYNDFYGHQKGDEVLKMIASTLNTTLHRGSDLVARYGGEEFVVILPNTDVHGAEVVASRLIETIQELKIPHEQSEVSEFVSVSVGISSTLDEEERTSINEMLVERADKGLYKAKENGRNRFCSWL